MTYLLEVVDMNFMELIKNFVPSNDQENKDKKMILRYIHLFPETILLRENEIAHITSSALITNENRNKFLMVHHNLRNTWAWTGGHTDGNADLLAVALKEAKEETGIHTITPVSNNIASMDILPAQGHWKNGSYVSTHLHLSISFILVGNEREALTIAPCENSSVKWVEEGFFTPENFDAYDLYLYEKLIKKAQKLAHSNSVF